ncbi:hypothetical protein FRC10_004126 [Ceratobasidium sp. 414]|nr:hypothetical protein FRC10_004126 [Ceratobasidium sp. 414]
MKDPKFETYTLVVSKTSFVLSKSQIERDAPNYFTSHFLDESGQRIRESLEISRDPLLFKFVLRHFAPGQADAEFYQLNGLLEVCKAEMAAKHAVVTGWLETAPDDITPG